MKISSQILNPSYHKYYSSPFFSPYVFIDSCSAVFCLNFVLVVPFLSLSSPLPAHTWEVEYHVLFAVLSRLTSRLARYFYCCCDEGRERETSATVLRPLHIALVLHFSAALQCICETRTSFNFNFTHHKWAITIGARLHLHFLSILSRKILFQYFYFVF